MDDLLIATPGPMSSKMQAPMQPVVKLVQHKNLAQMSPEQVKQEELVVLTPVAPAPITPPRPERPQAPAPEQVTTPEMKRPQWGVRSPFSPKGKAFKPPKVAENRPLKEGASSAQIKRKSAEALERSPPKCRREDCRVKRTKRANAKEFRRSKRKAERLAQLHRRMPVRGLIAGNFN